MSRPWYRHRSPRSPAAILRESALDSELRSIETRLRTEADRVRQHDLTNALAAVEGAATILEHLWDDLKSADRVTLAQLLSTGIQRLRELLVEPPSREHCSLRSIAMQATNSLAGHRPVAIEVAPELEAVASGIVVTEALRQLVGHAAYLCRGSALKVRGERNRHWACLVVEGEAVYRHRRPGRAPTRADAVWLAGRLVKTQSGHLSERRHPEGRASWTIRLPTA